MKKQPLIVREEADVYRHLAAYLKNEAALKDAVLELRGYPQLTIILRGDKFNGSITPTVMRAFIETQRAIYRTYAIAKFGIPEVRRLTADERHQLELSVRVEKGSSILKFDMSAILLKLIDQTAQMSPEQTILTILGSVALLGGTTVLKHFIIQRAKTKRAERLQEAREITQRMLSAEETKRMQVIADIIRRHPVLENIQRSAEDMNIAALKSIATARNGDIQGVHLDAAEAADLAANARR